MKPLAALALLLVLAGCSAQHGSPAPSAKPVSSAPHVYSATGPSENTIAVPSGAKSAEIVVTCGGSDGVVVSITVNAQDQPRSGRCPSTTRFHTPAHGTVELAVDFAGGTGRYVAEVRFSAEPLATDPKVATQCAGLSGAMSDIASADNGYPNGPLDLAGWQKLMTSAGDKLKAIDDSGSVGTQLKALSDWYGRSNPEPGQRANADTNGAREIVNNLCDDNGTPLVIASQYGG
jgi:hypothetical protein